LLPFLPPLVREFRLKAITTLVVFLVVLLCLGVDSLPSGISKSLAVPLAITCVATVTWVWAFRSRALFGGACDLILWEDKLPAYYEPVGQRPNLIALRRAGQLLAGDPDAARIELDQISGSDAWLSMFASFLRSQADIRQGVAPDISTLRDRVASLGDSLKPRGLVMLAVVESGWEWVDGREWRKPLVECWRELGPRSAWRWFSPFRGLLILLPAACLVPWAWWLWAP
jgi:hypothetical protein